MVVSGSEDPIDAAVIVVCVVGSCISTGSVLDDADVSGCVRFSLWWKMMSGHSAGGVPAVVTPLVM